MGKRPWRSESTTETLLVLLRDESNAVMHVVIGSALVKADEHAELSLASVDHEAPAFGDLFSDTPEVARRAFEELCELGDVDPDPADSRQQWLPPAAGLQTIRWLQQSAAEARSPIRRFLNPACIEELNRVQAVLTMAEASGLEFHLVEGDEPASRRFAGREIIVGPENDGMHQTNGRGPRRPPVRR
jgi:hypothetical protein